MGKGKQIGAVECVAKKKSKCKTEEMHSWVADLVTRLKDHESYNTTKENRMERRLARKRCYEKSRQQDQIIDGLNQASPAMYGKNGKISSYDASSLSKRYKQSIGSGQFVKESEFEENRTSMTRLKLLAENLGECLLLVKKSSGIRQKPFTAARVLVAKKAQRRRLHCKNFFQPRTSGYGGIGLARPSLYIPFDDPSWKPKLEEEFHEHIPGFFGKQRTKAMKKQLDGQMLWRQLLKQKEEQSQSNKHSIKAKKGLDQF